MRRMLCLMLLGIALLLAAPACLAEALPEAYLQVIETYYDALFADWYVPLTEESLLEIGVSPLILNLSDAERRQFGCIVEDLNGNAVPELCLGLNNDAYVDTVYQLFTLIDSKLSTIFTANDACALYLREDGALIYEAFNGDSMDCLIYAMDDAGYANFVEGVRGGGTACFLVNARNPDGLSITEAEFFDAVTAYEQGRRVLTYDPLGKYFSRGASGAADTADADAGYYRLATLYNAGVPVARALVPEGWSAGVTVDWSFVSTSSPGVGEAWMQSPDGRAAIFMLSNMSYADMTSNGARVAEGIDRGLYVTNKFYRKAADAQALVLERVGYGGASYVEEYPVADSLRTMAENAAQVKLQSLLSTGGTPLAFEGTAADRLYTRGNACVECLTLVTAAEIYTSTGRSSVDAVFWNIPASFVLAADSRETYEQYRPLFNFVVANSSFTMDFLFVNLRYGSAIDDLIHAGLMQKSYEYILGDSGSWLNDLQSSPDYESRNFADEWSDVIKDRYEYRTEDGSSIKVDTKYDAVYQDGDNFYLGTDGGAPEGWTKLDRIR